MQYYIENLINLGFPQDKLLGFTYLIDCPVSRSTNKSRVNKLITKLTQNDNDKHIKLQQNNRSNTFLKTLGFEL